MVKPEPANSGTEAAGLVPFCQDLGVCSSGWKEAELRGTARIVTPLPQGLGSQAGRRARGGGAGSYRAPEAAASVPGLGFVTCTKFELKRCKKPITKSG